MSRRRQPPGPASGAIRRRTAGRSTKRLDPLAGIAEDLEPEGVERPDPDGTRLEPERLQRRPDPLA